LGKHLRDDVSTLFENGVYLPTRTLVLSGDVDGELAAAAIKGLHLLDAISTLPITVVLNTPGGEEQAGMAIFDAIRQCRSHVTVVGTGEVMSMGAWILQAADTRVLTPNALVMIHYGTATLGDATTRDFQLYAEQVKLWDAAMEDCFLAKIHEKQPDFTRTALKRMLVVDTYLSAQEAVELGLADAVQEVP
jgi:ATP-dependent Clp protease protease subunit